MNEASRKKVLPARQERILLKIFKAIEGCNFDSGCTNMDWKEATTVDERSFLKKFFRDSGY